MTSERLDISALFLEQIHNCFDWALAGLPWTALVISGEAMGSSEIDIDEFTELADRFASSALLINCRAYNASACGRNNRHYFLIEMPLRVHYHASAWRQRVATKLLAMHPQLLECLIEFRQMTVARWKSSRHRWHALQAPTALPQQASGIFPTAFIFGLHWLALGGAESFALQCIQLAQRTKRPVFVLCEHPSDSFYSVPDGVQVMPLYILPKKLRNNLIQALVRAHPGCLVHIHHCASLYAALPLMRWQAEFPPRIIDTLHIDETSDGGFVRLSSVWGRYIDVTHVISHRLKKIIESKGQIKRDIRVGFLMRESASHFASPSMPQPRLPQSLLSSRLHVCMVSRMVWQKRPFLTLSFIRELLRAAAVMGIQNLRFTLIGAGPLMAAVQSYIRKDYVLNSCTRMSSATRDARDLFSEADLLVQCSINEGITLSSYEALERGCLVMCTDVGAQSELIAAPFLLGKRRQYVLSKGVAQASALISSPDLLESAILEQQSLWSMIACSPQGIQQLKQVYC